MEETFADNTTLFMVAQRKANERHRDRKLEYHKGFKNVLKTGNGTNQRL